MDLTRDQWAMYLGAAGAIVLGLFLIWAPPSSLAGDASLFGTAVAFVTGGLAAAGVTVASTRVRGAQADETKVVLYVGAAASILFGLALIYLGPTSIQGQAATFGSALAFIMGGGAALGVTAAPQLISALTSSPGKRGIVYVGAAVFAIIGLVFIWLSPPGFPPEVTAGGGIALIALALSAVGVTVTTKGPVRT